MKLRYQAFLASGLLFAFVIQLQAQTIPSSFFHQAPSLTVLAGGIGGTGNIDGTGVAARFNSPSGIAVDSTGNVYVADSSNSTIRKITPSGAVTTFAGAAGTTGSTDATGAAARFAYASSVAVDTSGNIYVADTINCTIRKITPAGVVTTLAGTAGVSGSNDATGAAASFVYPGGLAVDNSGNVYVADTFNSTIRKITPAGVVTTLAGTAGVTGSNDATGAAASFNYPNGVTVDSSGNVYVADTNNATIRKITPSGTVTTFAGTAGASGGTDGTGPAASFTSPYSLTVDSSGNLFVADTYNHIIRKITSAGVVTTLAGAVGVRGSNDGTGTAAHFSAPSGAAVDSSGNVYVADTTNTKIRKVTPAGIVTTVAGAAGSGGSTDATGAAASFNGPSSLAFDSAGNIYVADTYNSIIRKITKAGVVTTLAGTAGVTGSNDATGAAATFNYPSGIAVDTSANVYVGDTGNNTIRKITPGGIVTTLAGTAGVTGSSDATGAAASFSGPGALAVDNSGNVYVADSYNYTIRKITPAGVVTTLAGTAGVSGSTDATGAAASFTGGSGMAVDTSGNVFVTDPYNYTIRKITPAGGVTTLAGTAGVSGWTDATGAAAQFASPNGIAVDSSGNLYVSDSYNNAIRKVTSTGVVTTLAGTAGSTGLALRPLPSSLGAVNGMAKGPGILCAISEQSVICFPNN